MYFNRELSWLRFNTRVLDQACDTRLPLLERLKFLAIYGTNLDEFYMIRVAGLKHLADNNMTTTSLDDLSPREQLERIHAYAAAEQKIVQKQFLGLKESLNKHGLSLKSVASLPVKYHSKLQAYFHKHLYPIVVPTLLDLNRPFPFVRNLSFGLVFELERKDGEIVYGAVKIPSLLKRFVQIDTGVFVAVEEIVQKCAPLLFEGYTILESMVFRITCDADMEIIEDEGHDLVDRISEGLRTRDRGRRCAWRWVGGACICAKF
ncbi:hypothetical protein ASB1_00640 [Helicobacter heilmannii]|nr:hypothetical protein ASB1_00640 [Helicobacter heilmannii]